LKSSCFEVSDVDDDSNSAPSAAHLSVTFATNVTVRYVNNHPMLWNHWLPYEHV